MSETVAARWEEYNEAGRRSVSLGQVAEAEELFRAAVREGEQLGADSPHLATSLNALGQLRLQAKDLAEAERCFARALSIREQTYGPESHAIVPSLNNLAALHDAKGETDKAVELLRRSLAISEQALGASHPEVALVLNNLAKLYFRRRDFSKADRLLLRLLETKRALGKDHPEVATVLGSLAKLRQAVGKHGPAEQLWRQALSIRERAFAPNDPILATTLENVADCCAAQDGKLGEAMALRERAILIREATMGAAHPALAAARTKLDELRARPGAAAAAAAIEQSAPRTSQEVPSPLLSHEVPPFGTPLPSAPSPNLPWIQVDGVPSGERAPLDLMPTEPPSVASPPRRRSAPTPRPPHVVASVPPLPMMAASDLVITDSLAPEPPALRRPPERSLRQQPPSPPMRRAHHTPRASSPTRRAPEHSSATLSRPKRRSRKGFVFVILLLAVGGGGGWVAFTRNTARLETLLAAPLRHTQAADGIDHADVAPANSIQQAASVAAPAEPLAPHVAKPEPRADSTSAQRRETVAAKTEHPTRREPAIAAPPVASSIEIDAVTRGIEQSTKAKLDSVQKARIDDKAPLFKKP
ncbi:MAG: tetratricopeptide repeat protein [Gemmatimonadaceae bacterium]